MPDVTQEILSLFLLLIPKRTHALTLTEAAGDGTGDGGDAGEVQLLPVS